MTYLDYAIEGVRRGAGYLIDKREQPLLISPKAHKDIVSDRDFSIERIIRLYLEESTPEIPFLGEEEGGAETDNEIFWVLDPIDGTVNFSRDIPLFGISLALVKNGEPIAAVIDFPFLNENYVAGKSHGAFLNGRQIHVPNTQEIQQSIVGLGDLSASATATESSFQLTVYQQFSLSALRIRSLGSAALQLAWLAAGRLDISLTFSNKSWDVQAGSLLVREAGGTVYDIDGTNHKLSSGATIASNGILKAAVLGSLKSCKASSVDYQSASNGGVRRYR